MTERWFLLSRRGWLRMGLGAAAWTRVRAEDAPGDPEPEPPALERFASGALAVVSLDGLQREIRAAGAGFGEPSTPEGLRVEVGGSEAPLFALGEHLVLVQIPYEAGTGPVRVAIHDGENSAEFEYEVVEAAPAFFLDAAGHALAERHDGAADHLPLDGEWWRVWLTGASREWFPVETNGRAESRTGGRAAVCCSV